MRRFRLLIIGSALLCTPLGVYADGAGVDLGSGITPGQPWVDDGTTFTPYDDRDVDIRDDTPHLTFRDTDTNSGYQIHVDMNLSSPDFSFALFRGTDTGNAFSISPATPLLGFDLNDDLYLPQLAVSSTRCLQINSQGLVGVASAACGSGGGSSNSFETINVPAGTDPVAESSTDTLNITETSFLTITGDSATDSIDITQVTTDLGTDGLIAANAVALGTDTTNAYVATVADSGTGNLTVSGSGAETAAVTINTVQDILTTSTPTFANMLFAGTGPDARFTPTSGESFHIGAEYAASTGTIGLISDATSGVHYLEAEMVSNVLNLGDKNVAFIRLRTDGTGNPEVRLPNDSVGVDELNTLDTPADEECATYEGGSDAIEWQSCGGGSGSPAGSGSELQYRVDGSTFGAVTNSSVSGADVTLAGDLALSGFAGTDISLTPSGGEEFHIGCEFAASTGTVCQLSDATSGIAHLTFDLNDNLTYLNRLSGTGTRYVQVREDGALQAASNVFQGEFVLFGSSITSEGADFWSQPGGGATGTETNADQWRAPVNLLCYNLQADVNVAPSAAGRYVVSCNVAGTVDTNVQCHIIGAANNCVDETGVCTIDKGQTLNIEYDEVVAASATSGHAWSMLCRPN